MSNNVIIFDFDGTIADSFGFVTEFLVDQAGKAPMALKERRSYFGGLSVRSMAEKLGMPLYQRLWLFFHGRRVMTKHMGEIKPFAGVVEVVKTLHTSGYRLFAVSSNRNENIQIFLREYDLSQYFIGTLGSASIIGKTMSLRLLLWQRGVKAENCVYIGDEVGDIEAAHRLHIRTVAVSWGFNSVEALVAQNPAALVHTPSELLKVIN
jgi:phosphoglycolate phosphatase